MSESADKRSLQDHQVCSALPNLSTLFREISHIQGWSIWGGGLPLDP